MGDEFYEGKLHEQQNPRRTREREFSLDAATKARLVELLDAAPPRWFPVLLSGQRLSFTSGLKFLACKIDSFPEEDQAVISAAYGHVFYKPLTEAQAVAHRVLRRYGLGDELLHLA